MEQSRKSQEQEDSAARTDSLRREDMAAGTAREFSDVVIVGGGASGLAAAAGLRMSSPELSVTIIEKMSEPGRKLRATGSGRCNITNTAAEGYIDIMKFFSRIGLVTRAYDNGLVYPYSESAADVADLLTARAGELGVRIITDAAVTDVTAALPDRISDRDDRTGAVRFETGYTVKGSGKRISSTYVILACGGKAGPTFGTTGDGYRIARELGHTIVTPVPVLTSIECGEWEPSHRPCAVSLAGTRTRGVVTLYKYPSGNDSEGKEIFEENGEIQFTKYGLSGICIFNMTRHMRYDRSKGESLGNYLITADLYPDGNIAEFLRERRDNAFPGELTDDVLRTVLKENIAAYVLKSASAHHDPVGGKPVGDLTDKDIRMIGEAVHGLVFHPGRLRGWKDAQATSGGVSLDEIDPGTCESLVKEGLYITGELADRDFPCGGYNLSNAWLTGLAAAESIAAENSRDHE